MKTPKRKRVLVHLRNKCGRFTGQVRIRYLSTQKNVLTLVPMPNGGWRKVMISQEESERRAAIAKREHDRLQRDMTAQLRLPSSSAWLHEPFTL